MPHSVPLSGHTYRNSPLAFSSSFFKKDRLQISYEILRDSLFSFQRATKAAKCKYLLELITKNSHRLKIHVSIIDSVNLFPETSVSFCEDFAWYFDKICIRFQMLPSIYTLSDVLLCSSTWSVFKPINLHTLTKIVDYLKPTMCLQDVIPAHFLKQIIDTLGPGLLSVINKCLHTGTVPDCLKHATVSPYLKVLLLCLF